MNKKYIIAMILTLMLLVSSIVSATTITEAKFANSKITVKGTGTANQLVQIVLFGKNNEVVFLTTAIADTNGKFTVTLPEITTLEDGTYTIKTADRDGNDVATTTVAVTKVAPKTGDSIFKYIVLLLVAALGITSTVIINKKSLKANKK